MIELAGKNVYVVGLGLSGVAAVELCLARGARVVGVDRKPREQLGDAARALEVPVQTETEAAASLARADLIVVSPGVDGFAALRAAEAAGVAVIGEIELAARLLSAPLCAIGGTNGKSTTTELVAEMLRRGGRRVFCGGNLGTPLAEAVGERWDALVVEVSSFQLERAPEFRPRVSVLLNITDDHLDRHGSFEAYAQAKGNAFANQQPDDFAIAPFGDPVVERQVRRGRGHVLFFGGGDYPLRDDAVIEASSGETFSLRGTQLLARHNQLNAAAAVAAARALGTSVEAVRAGLASYRLLPHRLAWVRSVQGVSFYDDSKATNVGAAVAAIDSLLEPKLVLIAGGKGKDGSYEPLVQALERRARAVLLIGEAAPLIAEAAKGRVEAELAPSLDVAVERAYRRAQPGDAVLLAPACASFDMFRSYADRGEKFVQAVERLAGAEDRAGGVGR
ncbi:MAG TPA: UDP-N-acetylmuramoyl-L-alanine--D-glutamate ligase [Polyangiaceae bacterium]|jgi:UDP-N-acetylmuramoylalanine--D-glutamate ligase|nr:UDP-N-acetylmuramoyl-L-alanine--D-glutamate ligase [Polyangiaceae bacterium]